MLICGPFFLEINGQTGPIHIFFTPDMGAFQSVCKNYNNQWMILPSQIYDYAIFSYYAVANLTELVLNMATLV